MNSKITSIVPILTLLITGCSAIGGETQVGDQVSQPGAANSQSMPVQDSAHDQEPLVTEFDYVIVDTGQAYCYDDGAGIVCPSEGEIYSGQDAQYAGNQLSYVDNGDGTITDLNTGLMWQQDPGSKMTYNEAVAGAGSFSLAGYNDWRLPTIKELYSLILFTGDDPSGCTTMADCPGTEAFIDTDFFTFEYGDTSAGERVIDSQFISSTEYTSNSVRVQLVFGVNFADGRIKGYGAGPQPGQSVGKEFFVLHVRGSSEYGVNDYVDNGNGTVSDLATGMMWMQNDGGTGMIWEEALAYCENLDAAGYDDWRLPNAKELQSIVDYSRSPDTTNSAAIDPIFNSTTITNERGDTDYGSYWSSTTHVNYRGGGNTAAYVAFGRSLGYMNNSWVDIHGAGSQRSDPKTGDPADYPIGRGPQGDAIRIYNQVRCVRGNVSGEMSVGGEVDHRSLGSALPRGGDQQSQPGAAGQPPQGAIDACVGLSEGATCTIQAPIGQISGTCVSIQDLLACVPEGGPRR